MAFVCIGSGPFQGAIISRQEAPSFYPQKAPFDYPFLQSKDLNSYATDPNKILSQITEDKLSGLERFYKTIPFDAITNLYKYDFTTGTSWDFLPYPIVAPGQIENPVQWISHFKHEAPSGMQSPELQEKLDELTASTSFAGNEVQILETPNALREILTHVNRAKNHVLMSSFLLQCDSGSEPLLKLMEEKMQEGVAIYVILDKKFTMADKRCPKRLKKMGVNLGLMGNGMRIFHEKMYVFDGEVAIVDGHNLVAAQTLSNGTNNLINDLGIKIKGPLVSEVAKRFQNLWREIKHQELPDHLVKFYNQKRVEAAAFTTPERIKTGLEQHAGVCRLVTNTPRQGKRYIIRAYEEYLAQAEKYLYFNFIDLRFGKVGANTFGNGFLSKVIEKINQTPGLRADMLTNHWKLPTDIALPKGLAVKRNWFNFLVTKPGLLFMDRPHQQINQARKFIGSKLNDGDLHWWASSPYNHSKSLMFDNAAVVIGSYNINSASESLSYEQAVICHDKSLVKQMQKVIVRDALNSLPMPVN